MTIEELYKLVEEGLNTGWLSYRPAINLYISIDKHPIVITDWKTKKDFVLTIQERKKTNVDVLARDN